ncbi:transcription initiation factor IIF, beta subunit-domain-containing protein [Cladochytrium replicatum]|nr:transcription initiation factor IIF, beta subunit-domain-containing protein [Cladochytrium replicatum]
MSDDERDRRPLDDDDFGREGKRAKLEEVEIPKEDVKVDLSTGVWLVKVPKFVAEDWSKVHQPGTELGIVRLYQTKDRNQLPIMTFHLPETEWARDTPKDYDLKFTNTAPQNEFVFTENAKGHAVGITGVVQHEANVTPKLNDAYRKMMQKRKEKLASQSRTVRVLNEKAGRLSQFLHQKGNEAGVGMIQRKVVAQHEKKDRLPEDVLMDMLFNKFRETQYWNFKDLSDQTQQPAVYLREVLGKIAVLHKRGPYSNFYELKPELKLGGEKEDDGDDDIDED